MNYVVLITTIGSLVAIGVAIGASLSRSSECSHGRHNLDWFSPVLVFFVFHLATVPSSLKIAFDDSHILQNLRLWPAVDDPQGALAWACTFSMFAAIATLLGIRSSVGVRIGEWMAFTSFGKRLHLRPYRLFFLVLSFFLLGLALYIVFLQSIGGLSNVWSGRLYAGLREPERQGLTVLAHPRTLLFKLAIICAAQLLAEKRSALHRFAFLFVVAISFAVQVSLGSRSHGGYIAFVAMMSYHYLVRPASPMQLKYFVVAALLLFFVFFWGALRSESEPYKALKRPAELIDANRGRVDDILVHRLSDTERRAIIVNVFSPSKLWFGASYIDLVFAPIPRRFFKNKPPIGEGSYLLDSALGHYVRPPRPRDSFISRSGIPPGQWIGYVNFHVPGLLLTSFLAGVWIAAVYRAMLASNFEPGWIVLYSLVAFRAPPALTNQSIFIFFLSALTLIIICFLARFLQRIRFFG